MVDFTIINWNQFITELTEWQKLITGDSELVGQLPRSNKPEDSTQQRRNAA